jgi:hypothetical protein
MPECEGLDYELPLVLGLDLFASLFTKLFDRCCFCHLRLLGVGPASFLSDGLGQPTETRLLSVVVKGLIGDSGE